MGADFRQKFCVLATYLIGPVQRQLTPNRPGEACHAAALHYEFDQKITEPANSVKLDLYFWTCIVAFSTVIPPGPVQKFDMVPNGRPGGLVP